MIGECSLVGRDAVAGPIEKRKGKSTLMRSRSELVSQILRPYAPSSAVGFALCAIIAGALTALAGSAISAQDKYVVQVPDGLAFSEFRGYEDWLTVSVSQTADTIEV